ncbi:Uncharacterised protein [Porphyromonas macacae]|uniref:Uncharacterized protein n=1 Tax=Porphyromonas macacae TaxID=28115 RepID=A0A379DI06_9PORP|nr:Uncharacterised protein [Porphyromonas macacae]
MWKNRKSENYIQANRPNHCIFFLKLPSEASQIEINTWKKIIFALDYRGFRKV